MIITILIILTYVACVLAGYVIALYMKNHVDEIEHEEQNKCIHGHVDWDDCPVCGH